MGAQKKSLDKPDETRAPDKTKVEIVNMGGLQFSRATFQPGWRWSECVKPVAGTESCEVLHTGYVVQGNLHVETNDGASVDIGPGDVMIVEPGHDAWVLGDEPFIAIEISSTPSDYAKAK